jgi:hypothetical protein
MRLSQSQTLKAQLAETPGVGSAFVKGY